MVKRSRHRPFTAVTGVRFSLGSPKREHSSAGRALALQARCHRFEPCCSHQQSHLQVVFLSEWEKDNRAKNRNRSQIYAKRKSDEGEGTFDKASKADTHRGNEEKETAYPSGPVVPTNKATHRWFFCWSGKKTTGRRTVTVRKFTQSVNLTREKGPAIKRAKRIRIEETRKRKRRIRVGLLFPPKQGEINRLVSFFAKKTTRFQ